MRKQDKKEYVTATVEMHEMNIDVLNASVVNPTSDDRDWVTPGDIGGAF